MHKIREALEAEGHAWRHFLGALIFVEPWQYLAAQAVVNHTEAQPDQIVFAQSFPQVRYGFAQVLYGKTGEYVPGQTQ